VTFEYGRLQNRRNPPTSGAIVDWVMANDKERMCCVKVKDLPLVNWPALSFALLKNIVPEFPLCNKSFNQSYSGNDL
jgi:Ni,Fe-hydrogenase III large subunit